MVTLLEIKSYKHSKILDSTFNINVTNTGAARLNIDKNSFPEGMVKANALYPFLFRVWLIIYAATT